MFNYDQRQETGKGPTPPVGALIKTQCWCPSALSSLCGKMPQSLVKLSHPKGGIYYFIIIFRSFFSLETLCRVGKKEAGLK